MSNAERLPSNASRTQAGSGGLTSSEHEDVDSHSQSTTSPSAPHRSEPNDTTMSENGAYEGTHAHMHSATSPLPFFHPTRASGNLHPNQSGGEDVPVQWGSRESRKRVYTPKHVSVQHNHPTRKQPSSLSSDSGLENGVGEKGKAGEGAWLAELRVHQPGQRWPPWDGAKDGKAKEVATRLKPTFMMDISFWVALIFTLGSVAWVSSHPSLFLLHQSRQVLNKPTRSLHSRKY